MTTTAKTVRRGNPKVFQSKDGRWYCFLELPPGPDGKRRRRKIGATTKAEAIERRKAAEREIEDATPERITVGQAVEEWLRARTGVVANTTLSNYRNVQKTHITPAAIAKKKLLDLQARDVEALLHAKLDAGKSPRTCNLIRSVLYGSIKSAHDRGYVPRNVVTQTKKFDEGRTKSRSMTIEQVDAVLAAYKGLRFEAVFQLMFKLGLRPGECLGLSWADVKLDGAKPWINIRHSLRDGGVLGTVKTKASAARLPLSPSLVKALKARKKFQEADKAKAAEYWQGDTRNLVFTTQVGTPVNDRNLFRNFKAICAAAEVGEWTLYACRHTYATLALDGGSAIQKVSRVLRHTDIRVTHDTYNYDEHLEEAIDVMDSVLSA